MKYIPQLAIIFGFTLMGEALQRLLPIGIPGSVYGLVLLFLALCTGIVKLEQVKESGEFLRSLLPVLFVAPTVSIMEHWAVIRTELLSLILLLVSTTVVTFGVSGIPVAPRKSSTKNTPMRMGLNKAEWNRFCRAAPA